MTLAGVTGLVATEVLKAEQRSGIKAVAFDALSIFDPRPLAVLADDLFPGKGLAFTESWRTRQFEYTWLRVISNHYADFWRVTEDALVFAAKQLQLPLTNDQRDRLMHAYLRLKALARCRGRPADTERRRGPFGTPIKLHAENVASEHRECRAGRRLRTRPQYGSGEDLQA
jgi:hypothetical protein